MKLGSPSNLTQSREIPLSLGDPPTLQLLSFQALKVTSGEDTTPQPTGSLPCWRKNPGKCLPTGSEGGCGEVDSDRQWGTRPALSPPTLVCSVMGCCVCCLSPPHKTGRSWGAATSSQLYPARHCVAQ